jgi:glycosyltransferase involved in cell wall biosynthesis
VIAPSTHTANRAVQVNGLSRRRIGLLHHCLDPELAPRLMPDQVDRLSLLTVARISAAEQYKGHDVVIRALPALLGHFPDLVYDVVGGGDGRPALERLAAEFGVAHAVRFHGMVSEQELASHYAQASVFVMPSRCEGFGFSFLEAMAYGKPVVAGNRDAAVEVVRHGEAGLLIDPADVAGLIGAIARLLDDPALRQRMGARGAEIVARDFAFPVFRTRLTAQLLDVLDQATPRDRSRESTRLTQS